MPREFGSSGGAADRWPGLLAPHNPLLIASAQALTAANSLKGVRVVVPKSGTLHDFAVFVGAASGNVLAAIYDTSATTRNLLWNSGSVAVAGTNAWQVVGDPALAVNAGDHLDLCFCADNVTATFGRTPATLTNVAQPPNNFVPSPLGGAPKLEWTATLGSFAAPATLAESGLAVTTGTFWFAMARVA